MSWVYTFTPGGTSSGGGASDPIAAQLASGFALDLGKIVDAPTLADDFGSIGSPVASSVDLGSLPSPAHPIATQLLTGTPLTLGTIVSYPTVTDNFGSVLDSVGDVINLGTVP